MSMKMDENEKLKEFLLKFKCILCQLKMSDAEIRDEDIICMLLLALPNWNSDNIFRELTSWVNLDFVKARLRIEAEKRKETDKRENQQHLCRISQ